MKKYNINIKSYIKIFLAAACVFLAYRAVFDFKDITSGFFGVISFIVGLLAYFIWGFAIAFVLNQIMVSFDKMFKFIKSNKIRHILSIVVTYIITLGILVLFFIAIVPVITVSVGELITNIPSYVKNIQNIYTDLEVYLHDKFNLELRNYIEFNSTVIIERVTNYAAASDGLIPTFTKWVTATTNILANFIFGFFISLYMLLDKDGFIHGTKNIVNALVPERRQGRFYEISKRANIIFSKFLFGKLIDSIIIGIIAYIGFLIIGVNYSLLLAFIVGITNIIPYFGPLVGAAIACGIVLFTNAELYMFILSLIFVILLQQFDGWILGPKILHGQIGVSPLIIIAGVSIGGSLGGFIGMLIGVPVLALIKELFYDEFILNKIKRKKAEKEIDEEIDIEIIEKIDEAEEAGGDNG